MLANLYPKPLTLRTSEMTVCPVGGREGGCYEPSHTPRAFDPITWGLCKHHLAVAQPRLAAPGGGSVSRRELLDILMRGTWER